jgi:hypothetical protein
MYQRMLCVLSAATLLLAMYGSAETYLPEKSHRVLINLGVTPWKFIKSDPIGEAQKPTYNDAAGVDVGIPHCFAEDETFVNNTSGGGNIPGGPYWYRKHLKLDAAYAGKKIFLEFEGAHMGIQVYVNGTFMPTTSDVNPQATHVVGFTGVLLDITDIVKCDGTDNVIAVRVAINADFFTQPDFSAVFRFGQGSGGIFRPVWLHITDKVHVPSNTYSGTKLWGTYVAATEVANDGSSAKVRLLTNVQNESSTDQSVSLTTKVVDAANNTVVLSQNATQTIAAGQTFQFDQRGTISNPKLWFPNNSPYGKPNMHKVYHIVKVNGVVVDVFQSPLGIRTITWDKDFPYINGKKHLLYGASARYDYPALGTAISPEIEWRDAKLLADIGGNLWRPGHSSCSSVFVEACDELGIMLIQPSGEGEGTFGTNAIDANPTKRVVKKEIHRDMIIRDRNHPSILAWEASNGDMDALYCDTLRTLGATWDSLAVKAMAVRGHPFKAGVLDLHGCTLTGCDAQQKPLNPDWPWWGSEYWGRHSSRFAYDKQIEFCAEFLRDWASGVKNKCFGMVQWYLSETPGETGPFVEGINADLARSFGSSMLDFNRIPKFLYYQYGVCWIPYALQPRVALANTWNRSGTVRVDAFSNCPKVRLVLNGENLGEVAPNPASGVNGMPDVSNTTTQLPFQCVWNNVTWKAGTLKVEGLDADGKVVCADSQVTAGSPHHLVLVKDATIVKPNGEAFNITANGSDAALILAKVVDEQGHWCPNATGTITWSVEGPGTYRGGTDQFVTPGKPYSFHSPGDPELAIEGGMAKVAVRTQFTPGTVKVSASVAGLPQPSASTTFEVKSVVEVVTAAVLDFSRMSSQQNALVTRIATNGGLIKYFIGKAANVGVDVFDASGRMVRHVPSLQMQAGWHPVALEAKTAARRASAGVYFVRLNVNGKALNAQRMIVVR